jgi:hypothetical protein
MKSKSSPKKIKKNKPTEAVKWNDYGNFAATKITAHTKLSDEFLDQISEEAEIYSQGLSVVIVPAIDMRMNIQGKYENCIFVTQANSKRLLEALDKALDQVEEHFARNPKLKIAATRKLRSSSEIMSLCLERKISPKKKEPDAIHLPRRRSNRYRPKGQSDPNTSYEIPDLRKYRQEEDDFRGHHDHTG